MKNYKEFYMNMILESIFQVHDNFKEIINKISDDSVAAKFLDLFDKDLKIQHNFLQRGDENDQVYFLPDSQSKKVSDPWVKKNAGKVGRLVNQILTSQGIDVLPADLEKFINRYKTAWKERLEIGKEPINLVSGEDIKYWYDLKNYEDEDDGTLGNSCMRFRKCQGYFRIYTENPEVCKLAILLNDDDKLIGRCLVWEMVDGRNYIDRIYTRWDNDVEFMYNFLKKKFPNSLSHNDGDQETDNISVKLSFDYTDEFKKQDEEVSLELPYMDSLCYFYPLSGHLSNVDDDDNQLCLKLQSVRGEFSNYSNIVWSNYDEDFVNKEEYIRCNGDWLPPESVDKDIYGTYHPKDELVYSDLYDGLIFNPIKTKWGLAPSDDLIPIEGLEIPNIFRDNKKFDPLLFPVFTYTKRDFYFVRNLNKSVLSSYVRESPYILDGVQMLSIPSDGLTSKSCYIHPYNVMVYYKDDYILGFSNFVNGVMKEDNNVCYTIKEWLDLLPNSVVSNLKISNSDFYIDDVGNFNFILSKVIYETSNWNNLIKIDSNKKTRDLLLNININSKLNKILTDDVIEYINQYFEKFIAECNKKIILDESINYNKCLKDEFSKNDLMKDPAFMDFLSKRIYRWLFGLDYKINQQFEYFTDKFSQELIVNSILDLVYDVYDEDFKSIIIRFLDSNNDYYMTQLKSLKLFGE